MLLHVLQLTYLYFVLVSRAYAQDVESYSTPSYPSSWMKEDGEWAEAYTKARAFVSQLTLLEKVNLTTGVGIGASRCLGNTGSIPRLNHSGMCLVDTPNIVDFADFQSAFPAGHNIAATWDRSLAYARGLAIGNEFLLHGADVVLRPGVGPLGTFPEGGRNFENFGPDPYLSGEMVMPTVKGIQDNGVVATTKHYIANEQEHFRLKSEAVQNGVPISESISATVDDRTMHELYLWPFANAIKAGTGAIMASYNQINNSYSTQNSYSLNHLLKNELGFQGFVMSDYGAHESGASSALAGLDMSMPGDIVPLSGTSFWGTNLTLAVVNGTVPEWRLDDMAMRIMAAWYYVGRDQIDIPVNYHSFNTEEYGPLFPFLENSPVQRINENVYVRGRNKDIIREIGRASTILLKNNGVLPLKGSEKRIGIFGEDAGSNAFGANGCMYRACNNGTLASGWGSGAFLYPYLITPEEAISTYVTSNTNGSVQSITQNFGAEKQIAVLASQVDTALVFVNANSGEAVATFDGNWGDRNNLTLWGGGEALIEQVASLCNNTIVVIHSVGPVLVESWYDNPNVTAIVFAGLPGQESGNALVDVLYGAYNPSGKLPFTMGKTRDDYGPRPVFEPNNGDGAPQQNLTSLEIDYRGFDARSIEPIYEFGFGLSYTTFEYADLQIVPLGAGPYTPATGMTAAAPVIGNDTLPSLDELTFPPGAPNYQGYVYPYLSSTDAANASMSTNYGEPADQWLPAGYNDTTPQPILPAGGGIGGNPSLWEPILNVSAAITNTGQVAGHEVVQLYVALGGDEPPKVLRGFDKLFLQSGETQRAEMQLLRRDVSTWDVVRQDWVMRDNVTIFIGASSRKLPLMGMVSLV